MKRDLGGSGAKLTAAWIRVLSLVGIIGSTFATTWYTYLHRAELAGGALSDTYIPIPV